MTPEDRYAWGFRLGADAAKNGTTAECPFLDAPVPEMATGWREGFSLGASPNQVEAGGRDSTPLPAPFIAPEDSIPPDPVHRQCSTCQAFKPIDQFPADKHAKDGHRSRCRACVRELRQQKAVTDA